jgi:hypothetical protein
MSRFTDPNAAERFDLGPCECPGTPHAEGDWMLLRTDLSGQDLLEIEDADGAGRLAILVKGWNLIGDDGQVAPLTPAYFARLYLDLFPAINRWLSEHAKTSTLPKASAGESPASLQESGSPTRADLKAV